MSSSGSPNLPDWRRINVADRWKVFPDSIDAMGRTFLAISCSINTAAS